MAGVSDRRILAISGDDRVKFLQGLVSNEVPKVDGELRYAALLTPQGKYLADFFMMTQENRILIDVAASFADGLAARLSMYKLRADVVIEISDVSVQRGLGDAPADAWVDPRHPTLGWRRYGDAATDASDIDWDAIRVAHCIPESGIELIANDSFILEAGFERLNGVDFKKGCYVGQEVTARMKHKTSLMKGLAIVQVDAAVPTGTEIMSDGKLAGTLYTQAGGQAIAYLRFARAYGEMSAGGAKVVYENPQAAKPS